MMPRWIWLVPTLALLSACGTFSRGGGYFQDDGPGANPPPDVANIPDAVPKPEARAASGNEPYTVDGTTYTPLASANGYRERGIASWYGRKFHGKRTSSGEPYDMYAMTAAHKTLPLPTYVRVRNLQNGRSIIVRVNDRGPFLHNRLIDLSYAGAAKLGILGTGTGVVEVEAINPEEPAIQLAQTKPPALEIVSSAGAAEVTSNPPPVPAAPKLYLQVGAFMQRDNARHLRDRLKQAALGPIFIVASPAPAGHAPDTAPIYRVRIGPLTDVEQGDRLTKRAAQLGIPNARIVVE
ncbi:MAG: septal ring lytic transglycosylase RlpA family protein [Sulfuricaulis sp.]